MPVHGAPIDPAAPGTWPSSARLRRREEFLGVQDRGKRWTGSHVTVWFRPGVAACARVGLTVSRKVGNAIVRNRVKRWLREAFRRVRAAFPLVDVVCVARPTAAKAGWVGLSTDVDAFTGWLARLPHGSVVSR